MGALVLVTVDKYHRPVVELPDKKMVAENPQTSSLTSFLAEVLLFLRGLCLIEVTPCFVDLLPIALKSDLADPMLAVADWL